MCSEPKYLEALCVVEEVAKQCRDDTFLKAIRCRRSVAEEKQALSASGSSAALATAAAEDRAQEEKRRLVRKEAEHKAAMDETNAKQALEQAKVLVLQERRSALESSRLARQEADRQEAIKREQRAKDRWLQVDFPLLLSNRLLEWRRSLTVEQVDALRARVRYLARNGRCSHNTIVPHWWSEACPPFALNMQAMVGVDHERHMARSSPGFEWMLFKKAWCASSPHEPMWMLQKLLEAIVPDASRFFSTRHQLRFIVHENDYIMEKSFVQCIWLALRWLREEWFPQGLFHWPPAQP